MKHLNKIFLMGLLAAMSFININAYAQWTGTNPIWTNSNVGIGTSTPNDKLEVIGNIRLGWNVGSTIGWNYPLVANYAAGLKFLPSGRGLDVFCNMYDGLGYISFTTISSNGGSPTEKMRIINNGNVGFGTSSPIQTIDVNGRINVTQGVIQRGGTAITSTSDLGLYSLVSGNWMRFVTNGGPIRFFSDGGTNPTGNNSLFNIEANGNVGIGTSTPSAKFDIYNPNGGLMINTGMGGVNPSLAIYMSNNAAAPGFRSSILFGNGSFEIYDQTASTSRLWINKIDGNVGIGTTDTKGYKLAVNGSVVATSVTVKLYANWPDYVFMKNHKLPSILEIEKYVDKNKHLPNIPSATEIEKSGINLAQMDAKLLEKIEELTLYIVDLQKQINALKK